MIYYQSTFSPPNSPCPRTEPGGGDIITDTSGYIDPAAQIQLFLQSGVNLSAWRKQMYQDGSYVDPDDPNADVVLAEGDRTYAYDYDFAAADEDAKALNASLRAAAAQAAATTASSTTAAAAATTAASNPPSNASTSVAATPTSVDTASSQTSSP